MRWALWAHGEKTEYTEGRGLRRNRLADPGVSPIQRLRPREVDGRLGVSLCLCVCVGPV